MSEETLTLMKGDGMEGDALLRGTGASACKRLQDETSALSLLDRFS